MVSVTKTGSTKELLMMLEAHFNQRYDIIYCGVGEKLPVEKMETEKIF